MCIGFLHTTSYYNIPIIFVKEFFMKDLSQLTQLDNLFEAASDATDNGDYKKALDNLGEIIEQVGNLYGDNKELSGMKNKLSEVYSLLENTN